MRNESVVSDLLAGAAADDLAEQVSSVHTYPVREVYTIISAWRPTEVGLRGYPGVATIIAVGADDQRSEAVLNLVFGDAVHGLDKLRKRT